MTSSPSNALSGIPQELKDLFSWNPPLLVPRPFPGRKMSTKTREPAFFDKHFTKELKLLHVKRLPSLAHDIATLVDKTIIDSFNDGVQFPPSDALLSARQLNSIVRNVGRDKTDEKAVASFYDKTTALFCAPIASTLALRLSDWDTLLMWTQSANVYGYAIAEGFLQVAGPTDLADKEAQLKEIMDEETLRLFRSLSTRLASLVTNEFKNMAAGGPEVMLAIPNLSNSPSFDWTSCDAPECASATNHERERKNVAEVSVGPDAENTPWTFDSRSNNLTSLSNPETVRPQPPTLPQPREIGEIARSSNIQGFFSEDVGTSKAVKRKRNNGSSDESRASSSLSILGMLLMTPQANFPLTPEASSVPKGPELRNSNSSRIAAKIRKADDSIDVTQSTSLMLPPLPPVGSVRAETAFPRGEGKGKGKAVVKGKVQGGGDDKDGDDENDDPSYKDSHDLSAQFIATRVDGSIIVLQSGNHEFIGIRHRTTQTLYISDLIEPHACRDPSYGKLHVGIYIAGIKDALDRERQKHDAWPPDGGNGPSGSGGGKQGGPSGGSPGSEDKGNRGGGREGGRRGESGGSKKSKKNKYRGGTVRKMATIAHEMAVKSTLELASGRNVILLYLQFGIYDSSAPSTFVRSGPIGHPTPLPSRETVRNYQLEECLAVVLKSEIGHGATGQVLRGTLEVEASECVSLDVAVKLALASEQRKALRDEYKIYHQLRSKGVTAGITTPLGLFEDVEGGACILVMPYVGAPLAATPELVLPISYREAVLATLVEIHDADILHGDLIIRGCALIKTQKIVNVQSFHLSSTDVKLAIGASRRKGYLLQRWQSAPQSSITSKWMYEVL
ncbi:hypothetical protein M378DRAFT_14258 [Amanita muscaria Koide BX008]|uniref:Protein kinase domain-containing protein n=1 Tax=Amanita muscaria (strain Koide BX008) TaxID=946122 RepID=A0A0C2WFS4_AMAMK|nr:hypothetical protein M378DRAFT_14258 [Amanita muscaria Koide BX008]